MRPGLQAARQGDGRGELPRYLFVDLDDTFTVRGRLHPDVLEAVERASQAGIEVILNTGRPAGYGAALLGYLPGISAAVVENGGAWLDRKTPPPSASTPASGGPSPGSGLGAPASSRTPLPLPPGAVTPHDPHEVPLQLFRPYPTDLRPKLSALRQRVARRLGIALVATADNTYRVTDHTALRQLPPGPDGMALLQALAEVTVQESDGQGRLLASSIHLHFMLDGEVARSKALGAEALLGRRGVPDPAAELRAHAVAVGDSANDISLFAPGRFGLSVGVRNIERHLPELGDSRPTHITRAAEGLGLCELIEDLLGGRLTLQGAASP
jgi:hypothetical protein